MLPIKCIYILLAFMKGMLLSNFYESYTKISRLIINHIALRRYFVFFPHKHKKIKSFVSTT